MKMFTNKYVARKLARYKREVMGFMQVEEVSSTLPQLMHRCRKQVQILQYDKFAKGRVKASSSASGSTQWTLERKRSPGRAGNSYLYVCLVHARETVFSGEASRAR
ncbi:hypothetical protein MCOR21_000111 [Pyricularia oryzae]|uniref:Uncharacterized protein n=1 Tax=Pyricularia grisea TaxID=148305 RepID=A0ABQ8P0K0_PYRGI|nr:hypothetical protein MCOR33_000325 [Pyricularia grisea]KAI6387799.1 hypothetical protein MCOR32_000434 [Pyricularia oryzae]KAI6438166.1 hypothetical protein MCOR21_000111 [Pyricularia oryzae]